VRSKPERTQSLHSRRSQTRSGCAQLILTLGDHGIGKANPSLSAIVSDFG